MLFRFKFISRKMSKQKEKKRISLVIQNKSEEIKR